MYPPLSKIGFWTTPKQHVIKNTAFWSFDSAIVKTYITDTPYFDFRRHDYYVTPLLRVRLERWRGDNFSVGHPFLGKVMIITHFPNNWNYIDDGDRHNSWKLINSSNGNIFRIAGHLCGEFTGPRWIPHTKASDAELWCFLWSASG